MSDTYESHGFKAFGNPTKAPFSSLKQPTRHSQPEQLPNFSLFPSISQRAKDNAPRPSHSHQRIFPPVNNSFSIPQRPGVKVDPMSLAESQEYSTDPAHIAESSPQQRPHEQAHAIGNHQFRFMPPTPQTSQRPSSRTPSETPSLGPEVDADSEDLDLSEMMNPRMKEAKVINSQLAEERVTNANLLSQLSAVQADFDNQKQRFAELEAATEANAEIISSKDDEIRLLQVQLDEVQTTKESQIVLLNDKDDQIISGLEKLQAAEDKLKVMEDRVSKVKDAAKRGIENMGKNFDSLKNVVEHLKTRYEVSLEKIPNMRDEIESLRLSSSQSIKALEPYMDSSGHHLVKATETRDLILELQTDRNNAQQVIDFLRDKLHNLSTQLAEANEKIAELENRRKEEGTSLARSAGLWETTGQQVEEIASRLIQREREDAELLAEGLKLEIQLTDANQSIQELSDKLNQKQSDVDRLLEERQSLTVEVQHTSKSLQVVSSRLEEVTVECASHRQSAETKNNEASVLAERLRVSDEAKAVLQTTARKDAAKISELEDCVRLTKAGDASATAKTADLLEKVKVLETEKTNLKRDCDAVEEELRQNTTRFAVLQERFDSQTMTLKLAKEHSGDLQERLMLSEKAHATKLESNHGQYKAELAVLEEQKNNLQNQIGRLQDDARKLETTIDKLRTDNTTVQIQKSALIGELERLKEQMAILESTTERLQSHNSTLAEERTNLQVSLDRRRHENTKLESNADAHMSELSTLRERVAVLQDQLSEFARLKEKRSSLQSALSVQKSKNAVLHSKKQTTSTAAVTAATTIQRFEAETGSRKRKRSESESADCGGFAVYAGDLLPFGGQRLMSRVEEHRERSARQEGASERLLSAEVTRAELSGGVKMNKLTKEAKTERILGVYASSPPSSPARVGK